ncbi:histidine phosphatase family protein [Roseivivax sp.]
MTAIGASELVLIRHAPADHGGRLVGRTDVPALLPEPEALAPLTRLLSGARVVTSPALRCRQTAEALFPGTEATQDARLWEQDFGAEDGLPFAELPDLGPLSRSALATRRPPGGESFTDLVARCRPALEELAREAAKGQGPIAVVAHAGVARAGLSLALGLPDAGLAFEIAPLSLTRLRAYDGGLSVIACNVTGQLSA